MKSVKLGQRQSTVSIDWFFNGAQKLYDVRYNLQQTDERLNSGDGYLAK
jgi:hypothetical protein